MSVTNVPIASELNCERSASVSSAPLAEHFIVMLVFLLLAAVAPILASWLVVTLFTTALAVASWVDTKSRRIPNRLTYPLVLFVIGANGIMSLVGSDGLVGVVGLEESCKGASVCFGLMLLLFLSNATGGGDVKLATAIGAFLGSQAGLMAIAWCHLLAGAFAVACMLSQLDLRRQLPNALAYISACRIVGRPLPIAMNSIGQQRIPMAAFFTLGVFITQCGYRLW